MKNALFKFCHWQLTSLEHQLIQNLWGWIPETHSISMFLRWFLYALKFEKPTLDLDSWGWEVYLVHDSAPSFHTRQGPMSNRCFQSVLFSHHRFVPSFFFLRFLNVDHFKSFYWICYNIASVFCCLFDLVLVSWPQGMWDLSSQTRGRTCTPCLGRQCLNHWTTREVPICLFLVLACKVFFLWGETPTRVLVTEAFI